MSRFDYVKYDEQSCKRQEAFKQKVQELEAMVNDISVPPGPEGQLVARNKACAITKLEEFYMWVGKGIKDEQLGLRGATLQEGRSNG